VVLALALSSVERPHPAAAQAAHRCVAPADSARPPIPSYPPGLGIPDDAHDVVASPLEPEVTYYRRLLEIAFDDSTSGCGVRGVLARHGATVVDGIPSAETYVIELPDPGASWAEVAAEIVGLEREPGVASVRARRALPTDMAAQP
jgi:hypothetical protein